MPSSPIARLERARESFDRGRFLEAIRLLKNPVPPLLALEREFLIAECLRAQGYFTRAARRYRRVIARPASAGETDLWIDSCLGLVRVERSLGETESARRIWASALREARRRNLYSLYREALLLEE